MISMIRYLATSDRAAVRAIRRLRRGVLEFTMPAPAALVRPALAVYVAFRHAYHFVKRVFICEPLFKAYCTRVGKGVRTGTYVHWVEGRGVIVVGDRSRIDGKCSFTFTLRYSEEPLLEIGADTYVGHDCSFAVGRRISIGSNCLLARGVSILDVSGHPTDPVRRLAGDAAPAESVKPVSIGNNVWIGSACIILPGTAIGEGSVISAGSVVRGVVPPNTLMAGNPASPVATLAPRQAES